MTTTTTTTATTATSPTTGPTVPVARRDAVRPVAAMAMVDIDLVRPNPRNVRRDLGDLVDLTASIKAQGILQPLVVEDHGDRFIVQMGHRRLAAAKRAGLRQVPVIVRQPAARGTDRIRMVIENIQRAELEPMDEALAYSALIEEGMTRQQVAAQAGVTVHRVAARLDLLHLPAPAQQLVREGSLSVGPATQLARQVKATGAGAVRDRWPARERCAPHFTQGHPLSDAAKRRCDLAGHPFPGRLGPAHQAAGRACGACWEAEIRADERART